MKIRTVFFFVLLCVCVSECVCGIVCACVCLRSVGGGMKPSTSPSVGGSGYAVGCERFLAIQRSLSHTRLLFFLLPHGIVLRRRRAWTGSCECV